MFIEIDQQGAASINDDRVDRLFGVFEWQ